MSKSASTNSIIADDNVVSLLEEGIKKLMENKLDVDKIDYDSMNVNITKLKKGIYSAGVFITSNNKKSMGKYHLDRLSYIQKVVFIPATKKLGLVDIRGIVESSSKIKEDEENTKRIEQGIENEKEHIRKNTFASSSSPLKNIGNSPQKNNNKKKASLSLPFVEQVSILNTQREQFIFPQSGNELEGKTFVLTGTFGFLVEDAASSGGRYADLSKGKSEMTDVIIRLGGRVVEKLSSITDVSAAFVLVGDGVGLTNLVQKGRLIPERVQIINVDGLHRLVTGKVTDENLRKEPMPSLEKHPLRVRGMGRRRRRRRQQSTNQLRVVHVRLMGARERALILPRRRSQMACMPPQKRRRIMRLSTLLFTIL